LRRLARYRPYLVEILKRHRLPEDLLALAMTESLFGPRARSRSGAYGVWQFLKGTGREYLHINGIVDERRDPIVATDAAARMLKRNIRRLKRWPLAITGYNYGPNGMARAAKETESYDLVQILRRWRSKRFKFASRNYYASFLAALEVMRRRAQLFPNLELPEPLRFETLAVPAPMPLSRVARACGIPVSTLEPLNLGLTPAALSSRVSLPEGLPLRVPTVAFARCKKRLRRAAAPLARVQVRVHRVRKGESFVEIARRYGSTLPEVLSLNGLRAPRHLRVGEKLRVPVRRRGRGFTVVPVTPLRFAQKEGGDGAVGSP
jgi:membrane-bound lytic murein transglycosylase D